MLKLSSVILSLILIAAVDDARAAGLRDCQSLFSSSHSTDSSPSKVFDLDDAAELKWELGSRLAPRSDLFIGALARTGLLDKAEADRLFKRITSNVRSMGALQRIHVPYIRSVIDRYARYDGRNRDFASLNQGIVDTIWRPAVVSDIQKVLGANPSKPLDFDQLQRLRKFWSAVKAYQTTPSFEVPFATMFARANQLGYKEFNDFVAIVDIIYLDQHPRPTRLKGGL
jgi:hypothetical protein